MAIKPLALYVGAAVATAAVLAGVNYGRWSQWQAPVSPSGPEEVKIVPPPKEQKQPEQAAEQPAKQPEQAAKQPEQAAKQQPEQQPAQQQAAQQAEQPAQQQATEQQPAQQPAEPQQQASAETQQQSTVAPTPQPGTEPLAPPVPAEDTPSFDIVRVEPDGSTVVAGRSHADAEVVLKLDGQAIGHNKASDRGEWVIVPDEPIAKGDHQLTLEATDPDGKVAVSQQAVVVKVPESSEEKPLVVLAEPQKPSQVLQAPETTGKTVVAKQQPAEQAEQQPVQQAEQQPAQQAEQQPSSEQTAEQAAAKAAQEAAAKATLDAAAKAAEEAAAQKAAEKAAAAKAAQEAAARQAAEAAARKALTLGSVDYDDKGNIVFAGRAVPGSTVRLYVDNGFLGDAVADADGHWSYSGQEQIAAGDHRLRVDGLGTGGEVMARIELPFARAGGEEIAALQKSRAMEQEAPAKSSSEASAPATSSEKVAEAQTSSSPQEPATSEQGTETGQPAKSQEPTQQQVAAEQKTAPMTEESAAPPTPRQGRVVIQPGNNLWRIARIIYGHGIQYTTIYQANKSDIRDPDLIYPGQIFATPGVVPPKYIDPRRRRPLTPAERAAAEAAFAAEQ